MVLAAAMLVACGGGGGEGGGGSGGQLTVGFRYDGNALLFRPSVVAANISGLDGRAPNCSLKAGTLPAGMRLGGDCSVTGTPTEAGAFPITVHLGAAGVSNSLDFNVSVLVLGPSVVYSIPSQLSAGADVSIPTLNNFWTPTGADIVSYSVVGTLPPGLVIDATSGRIHGMPTAAGAYEFKVQVETASGGHVARQVQQFPNHVNVVLPLIHYRDTLAWAGIPFSSAPTLPAGSANWQFSAASLPAGLAIDPASGVISGTATTPSNNTTYPIRVTGTGAGGATFSTDVQATLGVESPVYIGYGGAPGRVGVPYSDSPIVINNYTDNFGGTLALTYSYALDPDSWLPAGITLDPVTGEISGTSAAAQSVNYTVNVTVTLNGVSFVVPALGSVSFSP